MERSVHIQDREELRDLRIHVRPEPDQIQQVTGSLEAPTEGSVRSAYDYLNFVLATGPGGGQTLIGNNVDYLGLPTSEEASKNVLKIAREGVSKIGF